MKRTRLLVLAVEIVEDGERTEIIIHNDRDEPSDSSSLLKAATPLLEQRRAA